MLQHSCRASMLSEVCNQFSVVSVFRFRESAFVRRIKNDPLNITKDTNNILQALITDHWLDLKEVTCVDYSCVF
jgi:hypothetical protein